MRSSRMRPTARTLSRGETGRLEDWKDSRLLPQNTFPPTATEALRFRRGGSRPFHSSSLPVPFSPARRRSGGEEIERAFARFAILLDLLIELFDGAVDVHRAELRAAHR